MCAQLFNDLGVPTQNGAKDRESMSKYREIAHDLSLRVAEGEFATDGSLPPELELAQHYGVARGTLRNALTHLARRGVLSPKQGSGWIIQSSLHTHNFTELRSFAQWAASKRLTAGGRVTHSERGAATARESSALRVPTADSVLRVTRLRTLDGRSVMIERTSYPSRIAAEVAAIPHDEPSVVHAMHERFGITPVHAEHTVDAIAASSDDARLLGIRRSSPLLRVRRVSFARDGVAIEYGEDRYLPGEMAFQMAASVTNTGLSRTIL